MSTFPAREQTVELVEAAGGEAIAVEVLDVSDRAQVAAMVRTTMERFGRLDGAHNNAGIASGGRPVVEFDDDDWDRVIGDACSPVSSCA